MENRQAQDLLVDHLRRDDASELTEVGLQAAATRLSQILLRKAARAEDVEANVGPFSKMVELLSHITRDLNALQQKRDADRRSLGKAHDPLRIKEMDDSEAVAMERSYSVPSDEMKLEHPKSPPLLQPRSTADVIAQFDKEAEDFKKMENKARWMEMLAAATPKPIAATSKPIAAMLKSAAAPAKQPARPAPANATKQPATTPPAQKQNPNPPPAQPPALTKAPVSPQPKTLNQPPIR